MRTSAKAELEMLGSFIREFWIILTLAIIVLALFLVLFFSLPFNSSTHSEFETIEDMVESCLETDKYTREECIILAGSNH